MIEMTQHELYEIIIQAGLFGAIIGMFMFLLIAIIPVVYSRYKLKLYLYHTDKDTKEKILAFIRRMRYDSNNYYNQTALSFFKRGHNHMNFILEYLRRIE